MKHKLIYIIGGSIVAGSLMFGGSSLAADANRVKLYFDGVLVATNIGRNIPLSGTNDTLYIFGNFGDRYGVSIENTGFWNREITAAEVNTLWNGGACLDYNDFNPPAPPTYTLTVTTDGNGTAIPDVCTATTGTVITIVATPSAHHHPATTVWTGDANSSASNIANVNSYSTTYTMGSANATIEAHFDVNLYTLTISAGTGGSVTPTSSTLSYGATVSVTATASGCYAIATPVWTGDTNGVSNVNSATITYTMGDANAAIHANFVAHPDITITFYQKVDSNEPYQVVTETAPCGTTWMLRGGAGFVSWSGTAVTVYNEVNDPNNANATITFLADSNLIGNYVAESDPVWLFCPSTTGGAVTTPGIGVFGETRGVAAPIVASPSSGYCFLTWDGTIAQIANRTSQSTTITPITHFTVADANFTTNCPTTTVIYPWGVIH